MANPSLKNGYISIAHELVEQLAMKNIPGGEMRILWVVWRNTWGWKDGDRKKDWDWIALSQFEKATGMKRSNVVREMSSLVAKRILLRGKDGLKFNQNYDEWVVSKRIPPVSKRIMTSMQKDTKIGSQKDTNKRNKETTTKETSGVSQSDPAMIVKIIDSFEGINPSFKRWYANKNQRAACDRLLGDNGADRVLKVIALLPLTNTKAYFPTITTPVQLEHDWAKLRFRLEQEKNKTITKGRGVEL